MRIIKKILTVLTGIIFIAAVSVLGASFLAKSVLVESIGQAGIDTAISHRMMDAVFGYAGADDTQWIASIQNKIEKNQEVQNITEKIMDELIKDLSEGKQYRDVNMSKELDRLLEDSIQEIRESNSELNDDMLKMMESHLKEETEEIQKVLNNYASGVYEDMKNTDTLQGKIAKLYTILVSKECRSAAGAVILLCAILTILLGGTRYRGLFSLAIESVICGIIFAPGIAILGNKVMGVLSNRMLGRTVRVNLKDFLLLGCVFAGTGVVFLITGLIVNWKDQRKRRI